MGNLLGICLGTLVQMSVDDDKREKRLEGEHNVLCN
jgi:hypothetical protein